ncbi:phosphatase PAP2 family protein [Pseudonocardia halophobica]|uniref:phosphatase PAP2 family protein n=1 Tax=Pseudonocardia halophobica TaxID=29401 RepID=UPI003D8C6AD3
MGVAAVLLTILLVVFAGASRAGRVDSAIARAVQDGPHPGRLPYTLLTLGEPSTVVVLTVALAVVCLLLRHASMAAVAVLASGLTGLLTTVLKPLDGRTFEGDYSMPSGHTGGVTALALVAGLLLINLSGRRMAAVGAAALVVAASVGMGLALVATNNHYPTDVVGGACCAVLGALGSALLVQGVIELRSPERTDSPRSPGP